MAKSPKPVGIKNKLVIKLIPLPHGIPDKISLFRTHPEHPMSRFPVGAPTPNTIPEAYQNDKNGFTKLLNRCARLVGNVDDGGSGILLTDNIFLTAGHVAKSVIVNNTVVTFNYRENNQDKVIQRTVVSILEKKDEEASNGLDYALLELQANNNHHVNPIKIRKSALEIAPNDEFFIPAYPDMGVYPRMLQLSKGPAIEVSDKNIYFEISTERGSSGACIIAVKGKKPKIVGINQSAMPADQVPELELPADYGWVNVGTNTWAIPTAIRKRYHL